MDHRGTSVTTSEKKLKQTRLSFKNTSDSDNRDHKCNKRKLVDEFCVGDGVKEPKLNRIDHECFSDGTNCSANITDVNLLVKSTYVRDNNDDELSFETKIINGNEDVHLQTQTGTSDTNSIRNECDLNDTFSSNLNSTISDEEKSDASRTSADDSDTDNENKKKCTTPFSANVEDIKIRKLTPKQILRQQEQEARKKKRELLKQERNKMRERIKAEKDELRRKMKEEKQKLYLEELATKNERRLKMKDKKAKEEEEKRIKEESKRDELRAKEERERKAQEKFTKFFVPKARFSDKQHNDKSDEKLNELCTPFFMPFEVKENMKLAPVVRRTLTESEKTILESYIMGNAHNKADNLYLSELKTDQIEPHVSPNTWNASFTSNDYDEIKAADTDSKLPKVNNSNNEVLPNNLVTCKQFRVKFLQFEENNRPAYRGTWRKRSSIISGRHPFKQDQVLLDYNIDSDDEWVDEESGESLHDSEEEKEPMDDYEIDDDIFVPHGYLSDGEGAEERDSSSRDDLKLNVLNEYFCEDSVKPRKINTRYFGCIWIDSNVNPGEGKDPVENLLLNFRAVYDDVVPFEPTSLQQNFMSPSTTTAVTTSKSTVNKVKMIPFPEAYMSDLIKLVHGHRRKAKIIAKEFNEYLTDKGLCVMPFSSIIREIKEIAIWGKVDDSSKLSWCVSDEVRNKYDLMSPKCVINKEPNKYSTPTRMPSSSLITKFTKILTPEEREKSLRSQTERSSEVPDVGNCNNQTEDHEEISLSIKKPVITIYRVNVPNNTMSYNQHDRLNNFTASHEVTISTSSSCEKISKEPTIIQQDSTVNQNKQQAKRRVITTLLSNGPVKNEQSDDRAN